MAQCWRAIYRYPEVSNPDKFTDKSVIRSSAQIDGERPGRVNVNGRDIDERSVTSSGKNGAPTTNTTWHIVIGGDYQSAGRLVIAVEIVEWQDNEFDDRSSLTVQIETAQIVAIDV